MDERNRIDRAGFDAFLADTRYGLGSIGRHEIVDAAEANVLPDPRIARIEAILDSAEHAQQGEPMVFTRRIRAILASGGL